MVEDDLVRRAATANIRSYWLGVVGLLVLLYATFLQPKTSAPEPATTISPAGAVSTTPARTITWRERIMEHTQGIGIALIVLAMLSGGVMHLVASGRQKTAPVRAERVKEPKYPTIEVFRHKEARKHNNTLYLQIRDQFVNAGWRVVDGNTDAPQHDSGIRVCGGSSFDRQMAQWGLDALGIKWTNEYGSAPPETMQVIVGRYEQIPEPEQVAAMASVVPETDRMLALAIEDDKHMPERFVQESCVLNDFLKATEPYVEMELRLVNASVFTVVCAGIEGRAMYGSHPFAMPLQLAIDRQVIQRGGISRLLIRQYIQPDSITKIREDPRGVTLKNVHICFEYEYLGVTKLSKWNAVIRSYSPSFQASTDRHSSNDDSAQLYKALADADEQRIDLLLYAVTLESTFEPHLDAAEPFIDFTFAVINSSVFDMAFERIEGKVRYLNEPLSGALEMVSAPMHRGKWNQIALRQWVSSEAAAHMKKHAPAKLGTGNFGLWFTYTNRLGETKRTRKSFPGDLFSIGD
jgi:hypothetical protein